MNKLLRPYGVIIDGVLEQGLEILIENSIILEIRPQTGMPDDYLLSVPFTNAHSHLEYRGMLGECHGDDFVDWIGSITQLKREQSPEAILKDCQIAAEENKATGIGFIGEHSHRPGSAKAMEENRLPGIVFPEVITLGIEDQEAFLNEIEEQFGSVNPHATYSVHAEVIKMCFDRAEQLSIHFMESDFERPFLESGTGKLFERLSGYESYVPSPKQNPVEYLKEIGLRGSGVQLVHCCDLTSEEIEEIAELGMTIAHCPRSNLALKCQPAKVRRMIDAGISVGLGLDSAASSGHLDFFDEMRSALETSYLLGEPLTARQVWKMATSEGMKSLNHTPLEIKEGEQAEFITINIPGCHTVEEVIEKASSEDISWVK